VSYDLLIKNGRILDGSGTGSFIGDVAVQEGRIALVGRADAGAKRVIDAEGLAVAPGFIDGHTHYDGQLFWDPLLTSTCWHGFTTIVMGHCGLTLAPIRERDRHYISQAFSAVEEIPLDILQEYVPWQWESYADYVAALHKRRLGLNVVPQAGHSAIRRWVMGNDYRREARPEEVEKMAGLLRECLHAGANGFTSTRGQHVDRDGVPVASRFAARDEVLALASVLGEANVGVFQMATETLKNGLDEDERRFLYEIGRASRRPVTFNGLDHRNRNCAGWLEWLAESERGGVRLRSNAMVIDFEARFGFNVPNLANQYMPLLREISMLPQAEAIARLRDPEVRAQAFRELGEIEDNPQQRNSWDRCWVGTPALAKNAALAGKPVIALAKAAGVDVRDYVLDLALEEGLATEFRFIRSDDGDEQLARVIAESPYTLLGTSDGGAHLATAATIHVSTSFLGTWVRERERTSLEQAVRKLTAIPAATYGLAGRGELREGYHADITVFDPQTIAAGPALTSPDLPGGQARMIRHASGIPYVIVNGEVLLENEEHRGNYPGRVLLNRLARPVGAAS
jgi:N-acyl-D-aspartate/D-glutamate deacylase